MTREMERLAELPVESLPLKVDYELQVDEKKRIEKEDFVEHQNGAEGFGFEVPAGRLSRIGTDKTLTSDTGEPKEEKKLDNDDKV